MPNPTAPLAIAAAVVQEAVHSAFPPNNESPTATGNTPLPNHDWNRNGFVSSPLYNFTPSSPFVESIAAADIL